MNNYIPFLASFLLLTACKTSQNTVTNTSKTKENLSDWEIATWHDFKPAVISHTWDDNTPKQLTVAAPIYDEADLKATFFIVTTAFKPDWAGFKKASENGHEIASHTDNHKSFADLDLETIEKELADSQVLINQNLGNAKCVTMAFPYCVTENFKLTNNYYIAGRTCSGELVTANPPDFMRLSSYLCGTESGNKNAADFNKIADNALANNAWAVYLFHGIDNDGGYSAITSEDLKSHLEYLKSKSSDFWVTTFAEASKYILERQKTTITEQMNSPKIIKANFKNILNPAIFDVSISVKKEIPNNWEKLEAMQMGKKINYRIEKLANKKYVVLNVYPNKGLVELHKI